MTDIHDIWLYAHNMIRSARQILNQELHPLNLSSTEGNILLQLLMQGHEIAHGQEMPQDQLTELLDISKPAVSRALLSMEKKGFVIRRPDPQDRRVHRVRLTDRAREIGPAVEQAYNRLYTLAMQGITPQELDCFVDLFARMSESFTQALLQTASEDHHAA